MKPNIVVCLSSVRPGRMADRMAKFVMKAAEDGGVSATLLDPLEKKFELIREPMHFMPNPDKAPQWMKDVKATLDKADGYILVSTEYNSTIPPPLVNMLSHFAPTTYRHRPCGIVTYAMSHLAGIRAAVVLRPFVSELGMLAVPTYVAVPMVHENVSEDGKCKLPINNTSIASLVKEVKWYANALAEQKKKEPYPT